MDLICFVRYKGLIDLGTNPPLQQGQSMRGVGVIKIFQPHEVSVPLV